MNTLHEEDFLDNPTKRVPVCLCLDASGSMAGDPIRELNKGVVQFFQALHDDEVALYSADVCIITMGGTQGRYLQCVHDFSNLTNMKKMPMLEAAGGTPLGDAVNMALDRLENRKNEYKNSGIEYYQPWLVIMTDGLPMGDSTPDAVQKAQARATALVNAKKLVVMPVYIGNQDVNRGMQVLSGFSPINSPKRLDGLRFRDFFQWLSKSVSGISQSNTKKFTLPAMDWTI